MLVQGGRSVTRPRAPWIVLLMAMATLGAGCGGATTSAPPNAASPGATGGQASASTPDRLDAGHHLDAGGPTRVRGRLRHPQRSDCRDPDARRGPSCRGRSCPPEGGELSATAVDGTTFVLHVPADALAVETLVRMTPVSTSRDALRQRPTRRAARARGSPLRELRDPDDHPGQRPFQSTSRSSSGTRAPART